MSYVINNTRGQIVAVVPDGTVNTAATPITLVGRGVTPYGLYENNNYVWILENFANSSAPPNPIAGQLWYNTSTNTMSVWNTGNSWTAISGNVVSTTLKTTPTTYSSLPAANIAGAGTRAFITDGNSTIFNDVVTGSGTYSVPVFSDGASWRVG